MFTRIICVLFGLLLQIGALIVFLESGVDMFNPFYFLTGVLSGIAGEYCIYKAIVGPT